MIITGRWRGEDFCASASSPRCEGWTSKVFTLYRMTINNLRHTGEEVKAKNKNHLTRARVKTEENCVAEMKNKIAPHALKTRQLPKQNTEVSLKSSRVLIDACAISIRQMTVILRQAVITLFYLRPRLISKTSIRIVFLIQFSIYGFLSRHTLI